MIEEKKFIRKDVIETIYQTSFSLFSIFQKRKKISHHTQISDFLETQFKNYTLGQK